MFTFIIRKWEKCDLCNLEHGMNTSTRWVGLSTSETANLLRISYTTLWFRQNGQRGKKSTGWECIVKGVEKIEMNTVT